MRIEINENSIEAIGKCNQYLHHDTIRTGYEAGLITAQGAIIYYLISWQKSKKTCYESRATVASKLGMNIRALDKAVERLQLKNLLHRQHIKTEKNSDVLAWILTDEKQEKVVKNTTKSTTKVGVGLRQKDENSTTKGVVKSTTKVGVEDYDKSGIYKHIENNNTNLDKKNIRIGGGIDFIVGGVGGKILLDDQNNTDYKYIPSREEEKQLGIHINRE